jgi:DNA-binding response OmpR family regulator
MSAVASILIVDDDGECRATVRDLLEDNGFAVVEAASGQAALDRLLSDQDETPALLVLDLQMPNMSGWQLAQIMKNYHRLCGIPVVVLSGCDHLREALDGTSVALLLTKPCDPKVLLRSVNALVGRTALPSA